MSCMCRRFKALNDFCGRNHRTSYFRKDDILIETYPGNEILRVEGRPPGECGMSLEIIEEFTEEMIEEVESINFKETDNYYFIYKDRFNLRLKEIDSVLKELEEEKKHLKDIME